MNMKKNAAFAVAFALLMLVVRDSRCATAEDANKEAEAAFSARDFGRALELSNKVLHEYPRTPAAAVALSRISGCYDWLASERKDAALIEKERETLEILIKEYPENPRIADAYLYLGQVYSGHTPIPPAKVDCSKAISFYEQAIARAREEWIKAQAKGRIGQCLESRGRDNEAQAVYREVQRKYPKTPWAKEVTKLINPVRVSMKEADALFGAKKYSQALGIYLNVVRKFPRNSSIPDALLMAGVCYDWLAGEKKDAAFVEKEKETLNRLVAEYPNSSRVADAYLYLGQIYSGHVMIPVKVDCPKARAFFEKAIAKADRDWIKAQAKGRIGQCLESMGRMDEAQTVYKEVLRDYPSTPWGTEVRQLIK